MATLAVMGSGLVTALGFNAPSTLAALQAGISGVAESAWTDFESGEPLRVAKVPLPQWWEGLGKIADLVAPAIHECLQMVEKDSLSGVPLLIGVAAGNRPGRTPRLNEDLLDEVCMRLDLPVNPRSRLFPADQVGCAQALIAAQQLIERGAATRVVVAGVDSFLRQVTLDAFMQRRRVMTPGNSNGFFPGEAGSAVLLGPAGAGDTDELWIHGQGFAMESATINELAPLRAVGLTQAVKQALSGAGIALRDVAYRLTDLSGEHFKFKEAAIAAGRLNAGDRETRLELWHPIEYLGEIGAAILPCLLAQVMDAAKQGYAPGPLALCHVGSDDGGRAAFLVGMPSRGGGLGS